MPCTVTPKEIEYYEKDANEKEFGMRATDAKILEEVACQMARILDHHGLENQASKLVQRWIKHHKEKDKKAGRK